MIEAVWQFILCLRGYVLPVELFMWFVVVMCGQVLQLGFLHCLDPLSVSYVAFISLSVWLLMYLKNLDEYPLFLSDLNSVLQASSKSFVLLHIHLNLIIWDLIMPLNVCLGWNDFLCSN